MDTRIDYQLGNREEVLKFFAEAADPEVFGTTFDLAMRTGKRFKRTLIGFCNSSKVVTLDEIASALCRAGIVSTVENGRNAAPAIVKYAIPSSRSGELVFSEEKNGYGHQAYLVRELTTNSQ